MMRGLVLLTLLLCACNTHRATQPDCVAIVDRLVELELAEQGFADRAFVTISQRRMRNELEIQINQCVGMRLRSDAVSCVSRAASTEDAIHRCLR